MKKEIIEHVKYLKEQGTNVKVDENQINDLINKIFDKKYEKKTYIESELDKFLEKYEDKNISKSLKKLHYKFINLSEFKGEYNKFMDNVSKFEDYKSEKKEGSVSKNQKKNEKICKRYRRYWSNGLVVKVLDSQSRGPVFKTTGWLQGRLSLSSSRGR